MTDSIDKDALYSYLFEDEYRACYKIASSLYMDETAIQSGTATLFIQLCNLRRNNPKLPQLLKELQERIDGLKNATPEALVDTHAKELTAMLRVHYAPAITQFPNLGKYIEVIMERNPEQSFSDAKERIDDYLYRNGVECEFHCILNKIEQDTDCKEE